MRDLKHLNWFENLLQEANNALIAQAKQEGKICVAFVCENTPEPLMNLGNAFGIRLVILRILRRIVSRPQLQLKPQPKPQLKPQLKPQSETQSGSQAGAKVGI